MKTQTEDRVLIAIGIFGLVGFLYLYAVKLFGQHGKPPTSAFIENYIGRIGWLLHWPTILTLIIFPVLVFVYYRLAISEEKALEKNFGDAFKTYRRKTPRFFPRFTNFFHHSP